jgi:periplasmic divalent cation tolerance protein
VTTAAPSDFVVVLVTTGSADEAQRIARALVEERLAGCVNLVGPIRSIYRWHDAVEDAEEHLLVMKARAQDVPALGERVRVLHSYDVPEILALPVTAGSEDYLAWLAAVTDRAG